MSGGRAGKASVVVVAWGALVASACATNDGTKVTWEEAPPPPVERAPDENALDASNVMERAAAMRTSQECVARANGLYAKQRELAWSLMRACVQRPDFMDVLSLKASPWNEHRFERGDLPALISASLRHGAVDPSEDLHDLHMGVTAWEVFRESGAATKDGALVSMRVKVLRHYLRGSSWISVVEPLVLQDAGTTYGRGRYTTYFPSRKGDRRERALGAKVVVHDGTMLKEGGRYVLIAEPKAQQDGKPEPVLVENDAEAELRFVAAVPVSST
jgi:hypothetical protein